MAKKISAYVKLQIGAGIANPSPPIGPALGQHGVNILDFCNKFNEATKNMEKGIPVPLIITIYNDRSFIFILKTPPTSYLIKKFVNIKKGSSKPNVVKVGQITRLQIEEIIKIKKQDIIAKNLDAAIKTIAGTARSMGIEMVN